MCIEVTRNNQEIRFKIWLSNRQDLKQSKEELRKPSKKEEAA